MRAVENTGASDEQTYTMSWREAAKDIGHLYVIAFVVQAPVLFGGRAGELAPLSAALLAVAVASTALIRRLSRVRVSKAGIRGTSARIMKWEEVNEVTPNKLGGIILQSTWCPSISVRRSVMNNMAFRQQVLGLLADDHVVAKRLREETSELEYPG